MGESGYPESRADNNMLGLGKNFSVPWFVKKHVPDRFMKQIESDQYHTLPSLPISSIVTRNIQADSWVMPKKKKGTFNQFHIFVRRVDMDDGRTEVTFASIRLFGHMKWNVSGLFTQTRGRTD